MSSHHGRAASNLLAPHHGHGELHTEPSMVALIFQAQEVDGPPVRTLVRDLDFQLRAGERWAILGPNGSGKSTIARTLLDRWETLLRSLDHC